MTDNNKKNGGYRLDDPALIRGLTQGRMSRRELLAAGAAGMAVSMAGLGMPRAAMADVAKPIPLDAKWEAWWKAQKPTKELVFANWPYYMDVTDDGSKHPSLDLFTKQTGINVKYLEVIQDNESFYAKIAPVLKAGQSIGDDIIVITGSSFALPELMMQNFLIPLWQEKIPNFFKNASPSVISPAYDPGNKYTVAWQSGLTGIAYNPKLTGREITSINDLFDPKFAGHVGMMSDLTELGSFALLKMGIDPAKSTPEEWKKSTKALYDQKNAGIVRQYYDQSYITALENGDTWITMAWSGDVFQSNSKGYTDLKFIVPEEGAMIWHDNLMIPKGAPNPLSALEYMNFYYTPEIAGMVEDYINYICPVPSAQEYILNTLKDPKVANSPLVFPTQDMMSKLHDYHVFTSFADHKLWNDTYSPLVQG